jgi:hypothetical protein
LLQEVASHDRWKINWNELVKKTSTGILSAKEYQMLWRHLAYGHSLIDADFEDDDLPLVSIFLFFNFLNFWFFIFFFFHFIRSSLF